MNKVIERPFLFYWKVGFDRRGSNLGRFLRHIVRDAAIFQFLLSYLNGCVGQDQSWLAREFNWIETIKDDSVEV